MNGEKINLPMKLGEGGEAFFVFETEGLVPSDLLTSPVISPSASPRGSESPTFPEPDFLDLEKGRSRSASPEPRDDMLLDGESPSTPPPRSPYGSAHTEWADSFPRLAHHPTSPQLMTREQILERALLVSRKLTDINIPSKVTDNGDVVLDMTGYKSEEADFQQSEEVVRKILIEEFGEDNLEQLLTKDEQGNLKIFGTNDEAGYTSDDLYVRPPTSSSAELMESSKSSTFPMTGSTTVAGGETTGVEPQEGEKSYAKTLRLTSDQLKMLNLKPGANEISFSVNKAVCCAKIFYWKHDVPIVISDIDGTITKSDALGHVLAMIGRDWTHPGVGKLFTDIAFNGYNVMYLTARSVGQADSTRSYLQGIDQNGFKLPDGPVILSPDRTMAALRREVIMKKPEVFKMACLRDIKNLYGEVEETPFFAGFGNRITDALSYRSVGVPSSRIFTINSLGDVHMELLELAGYKSSYVHIADLVDHFFPTLESSFRGEETYTDLNFWREPIADLSEWETDEDSAEGGSGSGRAYDGVSGGNKKIDMARSPRRKDTRASTFGSAELAASPVRSGPVGGQAGAATAPAALHNGGGNADDDDDDEHDSSEDAMGYGDAEEDDDDYDDDEDDVDYDEDAVDEYDSADQYEEEDEEDDDDEDVEYEEDELDGSFEDGQGGDDDTNGTGNGNGASAESIDPALAPPQIVKASTLLKDLSLEQNETQANHLKNNGSAATQEFDTIAKELGTQ